LRAKGTGGGKESFLITRKKRGYASSQTMEPESPAGKCREGNPLGKTKTGEKMFDSLGGKRGRIIARHRGTINRGLSYVWDIISFKRREENEELLGEQQSYELSRRFS